MSDVPAVAAVAGAVTAGPLPVAGGTGPETAGSDPVEGADVSWLRDVLAPGMDCVEVTGVAASGVPPPAASQTNK